MSDKKQYLAMAFCLTSVSALAGDFDGSKTMICAPATTMICAPLDGCSRGEASNTNLDRFLEVDVVNKMVTGIESNRSSPIHHVSSDGGQLVLQGHQNARGWSATIAENSGELTITAAGENLSITVFGACMLAP